MILCHARLANSSSYQWFSSLISLFCRKTDFLYIVRFTLLSSKLFIQENSLRKHIFLAVIGLLSAGALRSPLIPSPVPAALT
jgi:hypothetical protein